jgi:hypothetical protein
MARSFQIPNNPENANLVFPPRCVCCGNNKEAESTLGLTRLVKRGSRQQEVSLKYQIPHCASCARSTKAVFLAGCIPFVLGLLVVGIGVFLLVSFGAMLWGVDEVGKPNNANSLVLGAAAGLFTGLVGGFLFEVIARVLLLPIMGQGLLAAPLLAFQFLNDADYVAGLKGRLESDGSIIHLTFLNDDLAREFQNLNPVD